MALDRRESGWKLRDWQSIIDAESNYTPLYQGLLETDDEDDLREAKRRSLEDYKNSKSCNSLKSPNVLDEGQDEVVELYSTPRTKTHSQLSFPKQHQFSPFRSPLDQLVSFGQRSAAPTSDIIECDLSESKEFVHVVVGPEHEIRKFHAEILFKRPYFRDQRTGINFFELNQKGIYELRHPQLNNIHVDDFQFVAEFLTSGGFGIRQAEGDVQTQEAIFQCVSAWEAAEKLGAHDMLYHIAVKVQTLAWDDDNLLALANVVYRSSGPAVHAQEELKDAHTELKEWISETLAHRFWAIIDDKTIGKRFRRRLKRFPELERNVFSQRAQRLTMGAEMVEDAESDDDNVR
ncbi:hypothetical protein GQ44DRAFT_602102 [Phaeosphaeriaceae sp. PMI808]|nr:hypothetical protein GQ44DRAFT_602102 [Phaeosphaeriaceae sp. PMI808]